MMNAIGALVFPSTILNTLLKSILLIENFTRKRITTKGFYYCALYMVENFIKIMQQIMLTMLQKVKYVTQKKNSQICIFFLLN